MLDQKRTHWSTRLVAAFLAFVMLLGNVPASVFAAEITGKEVAENPWKGRSAVFVGDSITAGTGTEKIYYEYLKEALGLGSVTAMGVGGSCISAASDYGQSTKPLIGRYQNIPSADLIMVFMGTNDYGHETPLGTAEDTRDGTFYGALNVIVPALVAKHSSSKIVFVTPIHRYGFGTSKILGTKFTYDNIPNGVGATLGDYVNAVKAVCAKNGVSVIDLHTECTLDPTDSSVREQYMPDGLHPNAAGHELIAGIMESHIRDMEPAEKTPEPETQPDEETELVYGNKFASGFTQQNRISSRLNLYLKAGTVIALKNPDVMQWACAKTSDENSSNNLGYFPDAQWTDKETAVVEADGWVGFTFKYRDETKVFDLSKPLSDYITIEEPHVHSYEAVVTAPNCTEQGYTTYTCACGDSYVGDYVDALGHTYENGICTVCGAEDPNAAQPMSMRYDDHLDMSDKTVEIIDAGKATSYQVGYGVAEGTLDTAVVTLESNTLVATGIGTAKVRIDGTLYEVTVTAAPISLLLLIGQSNMRGSEGNADQSIVCPDGMVYATFGDDRGDSAGIMNVNNATNFAASALTGEYSTINVNGTTDNLSYYPINSLTEAGKGTFGPDSGFAYEWVKQTGEKVWVVNAAHGGSSITSWQPNATNFKEAVLLFSACQETLRKEIEAGHFTLSHMGYFWCQGCSDYGWTAEKYVTNYLAMHEGLKKEMTFDHDSDAATAERALEFAGIIPVRAGHDYNDGYREGTYTDTTTNRFYESFMDLQMTGPRVAQYWMINNPELSDIWCVCNIGEDWVWMPDGTNGVTEYFQSHYENGTVDYTTQVAQKASWYTPTTPAAVHDSIHYNQIGYNEVGREAARNALILLGEIEALEVDPTVELLTWDGYTHADQITASTAGNSGTLVVPKVYPVWKSKEVTYTLSDGLDWNYYDLLATDDSISGTLTSNATTQTVTITGHNWSEWETVLEPSAEGPGQQQRVCAECGLTEQKEIKGVWQIYDLNAHLQELPEYVCCDTNLWTKLSHEDVHFTSGKKWGTTSTPVTSITIPVNPGDRIYATSWNKAGENGHATSDGIRLTFFDAKGIAQTLGPGESYRKFAANGGYLVAPEGSIAINIAMWYDSEDYEVFILNREHCYENGICLGCGAEDPNAAQPMSMRYDDHLDMTGKTVEIIDAGKPTSYQVGYGVAEGTLDTAVVTLNGNTLVATGIGTAKVKIDGTLYEVTVTAAPISLVMITGHSMGAGQNGSADASVVGPDGQVYSSHGTTNLGATTAGVGISYGALNRANKINAFTEAGTGTIGEGSGLAWAYNRLTGEKIWVLNTAVGGSNLKEWIPGTTNYTRAVTQFQRAQAILSNEIRAGHYTLSNMGLLYHNGANFSYKGVTFTQQDLQNWYNAMWNGFKQELLRDMDGDGEKETVSFLGLVPIWTKSAGVSYTQDEPAGMYMASGAEYADIFTASVIGKDWLTDANVSALFPEITYTAQNGTKPTRPSKASQVFASDNVHYQQVAYNAVGIDIAENLVAYLKGADQAPEITILGADGKTEAAEKIALSYGAPLLLTPVVEPITATDLTYTVSGCISLDYPLQITATENGTGMLTVSYGDQVLKTITFTCSDAPAQPMSMRYDDHLGLTGKTVEIVDAGKPTSYQVGYGVAEGTLDTAVVTLEGNTLVATGIGTAKVRIDGTLYEVTVTAAPISLLLLIGQSNMQGSEGDEHQSIVCPDDMVYSTYGDRYTMTTSNATNFAPSALTGPGSALNVNGNTKNLADWPIYLLNERGVGKKGPDSGFAYEWVKQTGEKVWVVNAAHGGSAISTWQDGGANYEECVRLFKACQQTLQKEIDAGHFTLSHMGYFWCQGCSDASQTAEWYVQKYLTMHNNLKTELAFNEKVTFEFGGIIPVRAGNEGYTSYRQGVYADTTNKKYYESFKDLRFTGPRVAQYWMINNPELSDIWGVCNIGEDWVWMPDGTNGVTEYFQSHYENGTVDYTTQVQQSASWYTPTTPAAVHDSIHYNQIGYNEVGREAARNALIMLGEIEAPEVETTVELLSWDGYTEVTEIPASTAGNSGTLIVPKVYPVWKSKEVTYELTDGLAWNYYDLLAESPLMDGTLSAIGTDVSVTVVGRELTSYAWELENGILVSSGETENKITRISGSTENGVFVDTQYALEKPFELLHDQNWVLEWKMTGPWYDAESTASKKLFCEDGASSTPNAWCLLIKGNENRISIGYYGTTTHISYGLDLDNYGISMTDTHIYRLVNHINEDGANTIYLFVDGKQIGPMTRYFTGTSGDMGTESDYLSGKDLSFGYLGTPKYSLDNGVIEYISVVESGASTDVHFHDWSDWETVTEPGPNGPGEDKRICSGCGETEKRIINSIWQTTNISKHWNELPEKVCCGLNLWSILEHDPKYYVNSKGDWDYHSSKNVPSVTIALNPGDKIFATSFGAANVNGHGSSNGIRITFFDINGVVKTLDPAGTYAEFSKNGGYLIAPEGTVAMNIPMWNNSDSNEIYILNREHDYSGTSCTLCGSEHPEKADYKGKVISILGDSISTFAGYIPVADGFNLEHLPRYPQDNLLTDVNETWWMQVINQLDAKLGINDSWRGATVSGAHAVTTGSTGENAAMHNLIRIQNLGSNGTPDVILFYGGTNDLAHVSKVGTFDAAAAPAQVDLTTKKWDNLADGYVHTLLRLKHYYPNAVIVAMLPTVTTSYYFNAKLDQANEVLTAICEHYGVAYVDLRDCGITTKDLPDGIHPDATGMDYITEAVLGTLLADCDITAGEHVVYKVTHNLTGVSASAGYIKGISAGEDFAEMLTADNTISVTVTMGGKDITATCYADGKINIETVTGDIVITAAAKFSLGDRLQQLPDPYHGVNLWPVLKHDTDYYSATGWAEHTSGKVRSVTVPVVAGEKLYASSFEAAGANGSSTGGIRITFFSDDGVLNSMGPPDVYAEFTRNGYITVPKNAVAVNIPMWTDNENWELYIWENSYELSFDLGDRLQQLPAEFCAGTNLWTALQPRNDYYTGSDWGNLNTNQVWSVTIPVTAGDRIAASSFRKYGVNGNTYSTGNGIRVTWFGENGVLESVLPETVYTEFSKNGYITVPEGANAVNIPMWNNSGDNELYILNRAHSYESVITDPACEDKGYTTHTCACGDSYVDGYVDVLGHKYGDWVQVTAPTCDAEGQDKRICDTCGDVQYRDTRITGDSNKILVSNPVAEDYFAGKKLLLIGDSITAGVGVTDRNTEVYGQIVGKELGMIVTNKGVSGSGYCSGGAMATNKTLTEANVRNADVITIMLGVNDWNWSVKEGAWNGKPGYYDKSHTYYQLGDFNSTDTSTFYGALHAWCQNILDLKKIAGFEDKQFVVITPLITSWNISVGQKNWNQDKLNIHEHIFREYCTAIMEVCAYYDIPVFDANMFSGIYYRSAEDNNVSETGGDGVHVNAAGHALLAQSLKEFLLEGYSYEERAVADCGHSYKTTVTEPTCTEAGFTTYYCPDCHNRYFVNETSALGHEFGEWMVTIEPTCTEKGAERRDCENCDHFETREVEATGHDYEAVVTKPTCVDKGYTTHTCHCGDSYVDSYVAATGHKFGNWEIVEEPTCTEKGEERRDCTNCDHFETREVDATGHDYVAVVTKSTCVDKGYTTHTCHCGDSYVDSYVDAVGHKFGEWEVVNEPTCTEKGMERRDCENCDHFETREIAATVHDYEVVVTEPTCTEKGFTTHTCHCGNSYVDSYVETTGHEFGEWTVTSEPNCTEKGMERRDCANCDHFETCEVEAMGHNYEAVVTAPTCVDKGYTTHTCHCGDSYINSYVDAVGHKFGEWTLTTEPTCTEKGEERRDCANCDHFETCEVEAMGHNYEAVVTAPTCTDKGFTTHTCHCGDSYIDSYVEATGHEFGEWMATTEPSCTEKGEERRDCENCDHFETREVDAIGHDYETVVTKPTCIEKGYTTHTCHCGDSYINSYVDAVGHKFGEWTLTTEPTCTEKGEERRDCANCDHFETREVEDTGHDYEAVVTKPTCEDKGYTTHTCHCGDSYIDSYVEAIGHKFGNWAVVDEPTCTEKGMERRECANCNHFETREVAAIGHDYDAVVTNPTCMDKGYTTHTCHCGDSYVDSYVNALGHEYGEWYVTKQATLELEGEERRDCDRCDDFQTRKIPKLVHNYTSIVIAPTCIEQGYTTHTCQNCGDQYVDTYVNALGHSFVDYVSNDDATCTVDGTKTAKCERCDETDTIRDVGTAKGHKFGEWTVTKVPTCTEKGEERRDCANCDHFETREVAAAGHDYEAVVTKPTCSDKGFTTRTCHCGDSYVDSYVDATGHKFGEWTVTIEPTCTENGKERRDCDNCDHFETREVDATGHDYEAVVTKPTCVDKGYTTHTCHCGNSYADSYVNALGHKYENGSCSICGEPEVKYLPGDVDLDGDVDVDDVLALLWYVLFPEDYPIEVDADFDCNGSTDVDDVLTLLWYVLFPEDYPLN